MNNGSDDIIINENHKKMYGRFIKSGSWLWYFWAYVFSKPKRFIKWWYGNRITEDHLYEADIEFNLIGNIICIYLKFAIDQEG